MSKPLYPSLPAGKGKPHAGYEAEHFLWSAQNGVATITLDRPERTQTSKLQRFKLHEPVPGQ